MKDSRTYIKLHDGMPDHPKVECLSDAAFRLLVSTWCWCSRQKTDGAVLAGVWARRGTPKARAELEAAGLVEQTPTGVLMHDYTQHQQTRDEIAERRQLRQAAGSKGGKATAEAQANAKQVLEQDLKPFQADVDVDVEKITSTPQDQTLLTAPRKRSARTTGTRLPDQWQPSEPDLTWQRSAGIADDLARREYAKFVDYWRAKAGRDATKLDWSLTWRNWLRTAVERTPTGNGATRRTSDDKYRDNLRLIADMQAREARLEIES